MSLVVVLGVPLLLFSAAVVVMCFHEETPGLIGKVYRLLAVRIPNLLTRIIKFIPGGSLCLSCFSGTYNYVFHKPNPLMQGFYLVLVLGGFGVFVALGLPLIPNTRLGSIHLALPFVFVLCVLFTFTLASIAPPGYVTKRNFEMLERIYPYDGFIFVKRECTTCGTPRIARSKHCRMLNQCVEKYDHFCPWINNTVGALNFRWFLLFVFTTASFLVYGTYVFYNIIQFIIERDKLWSLKFMNTATNEVVNADWKVILPYMIGSYGPILFVFLLCLIMGFTLVLFFLYQLYLVKNGTTANEGSKWSEVSDFYCSAKWQREVETRGQNFSEESVPVGQNAPPLNDRMVKEFPSKQPPNVYDKGFRVNFMNVLFPESLPTRMEMMKQMKQAKNGNGEQNSDKPIKVAPTNEVNATVSKNNGGKKKNKKKE